MTYQARRYLLMTVDPVHIGTGGYRLGRVDLAIAREPGTHLPKIPGTSLAGVARAYAAARYEKLRCAGQGQPRKDTAGKVIPNTDHCGEAACPICYTFGYAKGDEGSGYAGTVSLFDATIALFPVHSLAGPVWATTPGRLREAGFVVTGPAPAPDAAVVTGGWNKPLNLGWLMLPTTGGAQVQPPGPCWLGEAEPAWQAIQNRIVLVDEGLFSQVVNANLEVRTSVSIDPFTGAAATGALFTYEAIPRAAWLAFDVVEDDYRRDPKKPWPVDKTHLGKPLGETWASPHDVAAAGLALAEWLGVGGMGTRGFGRIRLMGHWRPDQRLDQQGGAQ
ncbi:MAG: type III-B CRISPR module RAMP protein Cmr4 [Chloroflexi bacterium]|nr:type III-B CRISPR module RAMP protein Cmr4 [Chloroflexota bacterium]MBU1746206.1 type III-B CRISPR module RAMP protein Cmr4 [Chloroflexota bacterium]